MRLLRRLARVIEVGGDLCGRMQAAKNLPETSQGESKVARNLQPTFQGESKVKGNLVTTCPGNFKAEKVTRQPDQDYSNTLFTAIRMLLSNGKNAEKSTTAKLFSLFSTKTIETAVPIFERSALSMCDEQKPDGAKMELAMNNQTTDQANAGKTRNLNWLIQVWNFLLVVCEGVFQVVRNLVATSADSFHLEKVTGQPAQSVKKTDQDPTVTLAARSDLGSILEKIQKNTWSQNFFHFIPEINIKTRVPIFEHPALPRCEETKSDGTKMEMVMDNQTNAGKPRNLNWLIQVWHFLMVAFKGGFQVMRNLLVTSPGASKVKNNLLTTSAGNFRLEKVTGQPAQVEKETDKDPADTLAISPGCGLNPEKNAEKSIAIKLFSLFSGKNTKKPVPIFERPSLSMCEGAKPYGATMELAMDNRTADKANAGKPRNLNWLLQVWNCLVVACKGGFQVVRNLLVPSKGELQVGRNLAGHSKVVNNLVATSAGKFQVEKHLAATCPGNFKADKVTGQPDQVGKETGKDRLRASANPVPIFERPALSKCDETNSDGAKMASEMDNQTTGKANAGQTRNLNWLLQVWNFLMVACESGIQVVMNLLVTSKGELQVTRNLSGHSKVVNNLVAASAGNFQVEKHLAATCPGNFQAEKVTVQPDQVGKETGKASLNNLFIAIRMLLPNGENTAKSMAEKLFSLFSGKTIEKPVPVFERLALPMCEETNSDGATMESTMNNRTTAQETQGKSRNLSRLLQVWSWLLVACKGGLQVVKNLLVPSKGELQVGRNLSGHSKVENNLVTASAGNFHLEKVTGQPDQVGKIAGKDTAGSLAISPGVELTPGEANEKRTFFALLVMNFRPSCQVKAGNLHYLNRLFQVWNYLMVACKGEFQVVRNLFTASPGASKVKNNLLTTCPGNFQVVKNLLVTLKGQVQVVQESYKTSYPPTPACAGWGLP